MNERQTIFSSCRKYRYTLWRDWSDIGGDCLFSSAHGNAHRFVQFIGLNPSTADETLDDPTIRRCIGFAKAWGYGALCMTNLFAFRATDPEVMKVEEFPVGESYMNDLHLYRTAEKAGIVICAWGKHGSHGNERGKFVKARLMEVASTKLYHLGLNSDGSPRHPLYLSAKTVPALWY